MDTLEDSVLKAVDLVAEQSQDKVTKQLQLSVPDLLNSRISDTR